MNHRVHGFVLVALSIKHEWAGQNVPFFIWEMYGLKYKSSKKRGGATGLIFMFSPSPPPARWRGLVFGLALSNVNNGT